MPNIRKVPFFNYRYFYENHRDQLLNVTDNILQRGAFIMQQDVRTFEQRIADYLGIKHVLAVANCTDGLEIALQALGIGPGDEVIFPSNTFVATASAIKMNGATPVPADCGKDHLIDPISIEKSITKNTKAIMPAQLNGRTCNMDPILDIAKKYNLLIVEDAAQGLGSSFKGKKAGTFGIAAAISFYPAKILGCLGDGGVVMTDNDQLADEIKLIRDHGRNKDGLVSRWGRNSRLDNLQAAYLNYFFDSYESTINRRREIAAIYHQRLSSIQDILLPPGPKADPDHFDVFQNYEIESSFRNQLEAHLNQQGVGTLKQWGGKGVHQMPDLGFNLSLPATEKMTARALMLPMNMAVSDEDANYVCDQVFNFYEQQEKLHMAS